MLEVAQIHEIVMGEVVGMGLVEVQVLAIGDEHVEAQLLDVVRNDRPYLLGEGEVGLPSNVVN